MMRPDHQKTMGIGIVPIGDVPDPPSRIIAAHVSGYLDLEAWVLPTIALPAGTRDPQRLQHDAGKMIAALESEPFTAAYPKLVGVVDVDLCLPIFAQVFGEARQGGQWALVSLYHLRPRSPKLTEALAYERLAKIALHEIGHLFNLQHCEGPGCLMQFSGGLAELDRLPLQFCRYCRIFFKDAVHGAGASSQRG